MGLFLIYKKDRRSDSLSKRGRVYNRIYNEQEWNTVNEFNKNLLEDFLIELESNKKSKGTINQYKNDMRIIFIYILKKLQNKPITELNKKHFRNINLWFINDLGLSSARCNRLMSAVRSMLTFAEEDDDYDYEINYASKVKGLSKETVREIYFLTDTQIERLRNELIKRKKYLHVLYLDLSYDSCARRNECYQVLKENLLERNYTNTVIGKRGKKFPLIYFDRTLESLKLYLKQRGEDEIPELWVQKIGDEKRIITYNTLYSYIIQMANILEEIEGEYIPFNPHSLRHSALENMNNGSHYICKKIGKENGFSLEELKVLANHSDISTTSSYLRNKDTDILEGMFGIKLK